MQTRDKDMPDLDALFGMARDQTPKPSPDLMARVMADALAQQPLPRPLTPPPTVLRRGLVQALAELFGGMGALAGIGSAAAAGLVLGFVQPTGLADFTAMLGGEQVQSLSLIPSVDDLIAEATP